jgi:hypothetical protein
VEGVVVEPLRLQLLQQQQQQQIGMHQVTETLTVLEKESPLAVISLTDGGEMYIYVEVNLAVSIDQVKFLLKKKTSQLQEIQLVIL